MQDLQKYSTVFWNLANERVRVRRSEVDDTPSEGLMYQLSLRPGCYTGLRWRSLSILPMPHGLSGTASPTVVTVINGL